jgi:hypothetical protein
MKGSQGKTVAFNPSQSGFSPSTGQKRNEKVPAGVERKKDNLSVVQMVGTIGRISFTVRIACPVERDLEYSEVPELC